jgi:23S rRNA (guanosine2251-2'-O)-methyltransferase
VTRILQRLNGKVKMFFLFGSEGFGMREHTGKYADFFVKIDMNKDIESLNISNSAAIVFHHLSYLKKKS